MAQDDARRYRFTHLVLENWCNFKRVDVPLRARVFIVGPNASGKSNLLHVFRFLREIVSVGGGLQEAVRSRQGVSALRCLAARGSSDIIVSVTVGTENQPSSWTYELRFGQDSSRRPVVRSETVRRGTEVVLSRPDKDDEADPARLTQTHIEQVLANQKFRELAEFLGTVKYLHIVPQLIREPDRSAGRRDDPFGGDFLEQIARTPQNTRNARLRRITEALRVALPQLKQIELSRDARGTPHLRGKYEHWRPRGAWQNEGLFSDGTLRLLGLLWAILGGYGPLLLEEPELSLHAGVVRYIPLLFARAQRGSGRQVIVTTHSSDMLRDEGIGLDEVLLLDPRAEGTVVAPAGSRGNIRELVEKGVSLADAVEPETAPANLRQLTLWP